MLIYKISATSSTNSYLKSLLKENDALDELVVITEEQTQGRGQVGTSWHSQKGKSLTFSIYKQFNGLNVAQQFYISMAVSIAVMEVLESFGIPEIKVKWPNDILSANKKLCGVLIENVLYHKNIKGSIIGIGLNVNNSQYTNLPNASSMKLATDKHFEIEQVFNELLNRLMKKINLLENNQFNQIEERYLKNLYRINQISVFENAQKESFNGIIRGVSNEGKLLVETEDEAILAFDLKEIKLLTGLK
ncbi:MAG: biotin--[acetyl-CoA-carboxylase] ligase [Flavobacteriaceae bacterium]